MKWYSPVKRILDCIFAVSLLLLVSPMMIAAAIAIKLESKGPVLFRQQRPGKNGKIFTICKFRTMKTQTHKDGRELSNTERMTKVGSVLRKTSIDELPQLFNVISGQMSFIGPRPLLVRYLPYYTDQEMKRHDVAPGITGWAQVNGRNALPWEQKFAYDLYYVENLSFILDFKIFFMTLKKILKRSDVIVFGTENSPEAFDVERKNQIAGRKE